MDKLGIKLCLKYFLNISHMFIITYIIDHTLHCHWLEEDSRSVIVDTLQCNSVRFLYSAHCNVHQCSSPHILAVLADSHGESTCNGGLGKLIWEFDEVVEYLVGRPYYNLFNPCRLLVFVLTDFIAGLDNISLVAVAI